MRFTVDAWAPEYGAAAEESALAPSSVPTDITAEVAIDGWAPRRPPPDTTAPESVLFVDGVRRIEARVWISASLDDPVVHQGICASYAAGVVRCDGRAEVVDAAVERRLFAPAAGAADLETRVGTFAHTPITADRPDAAIRALQRAMGGLEAALAERAARARPGELIVVDGPLSQHRYLPGAVGSIKSQQAAYGPPIVPATVAKLAPGERTPVFLVGETFTRWSWYVRLPGPGGHALAGVVRCEGPSSLPVAEVVGLADRVTLALPRFASQPHKDPRAPQNLYPIAGLERALRRRLGDPALLYRALRAAAA